MNTAYKLNSTQHKTHLFVWSGANQQNKVIRGELNAISPNFVKAYLFQQGITPISVRKKKFTFLKKTYGKINLMDIAIFFRQFATLFSAGVPIVQCLEILRLSQNKLLLQNLLLTIKNEIESGKELAFTLKKYPNYFNRLTCQLILAGEKSGTLDIMLTRIANRLEKIFLLKRQLKQALLYPAVITLTAILVTMVMFIFVVPQFDELFNSMHTTLPAFTRFIIFISKLIRQHSWLFLIPFLSALPLAYVCKKSQRLKKQLDQIILKIPGLGLLTQKIILSRLFRSLATLISSGIPMTEALIISADSCNNHIYTQAVSFLHKEILSGRQLHTAMHSQSLFPKMATQMVKIGEDSGTLDKMLNKVADVYENDINYFISHLNHLLEPLIMLVLGVLIGGLVIALYLPIFKLGTVI